MELNRRLVITLVALATLGTRIGINITSPLLLDTLSPPATNINNTTKKQFIINFSLQDSLGFDFGSWMGVLPFSHADNVAAHEKPSTNETYHEISPYFVVFGQWITITVVFGISLVITLICFPYKITMEDKQFPKSQIVITGVSQGISSILVNYGYSGTRTPPYLQAVLVNFNIPVQFFIRFLILHKRPTIFKLCCAIVVLLAEFICLLTTIFPGLESTSQHRREGGSSGVGRIIYPMLFVVSVIPHAIANSVTERGVQYTTSHNTNQISQRSQMTDSRQQTHPRNRRINMVYFMFWWSLFNTMTLLLLFWVDIIPVIGTSDNIHAFLEKMKFGVICSVGQGGCGTVMIAIMWTHFLSVLGSVFFFNLFLRYSEGANFVAITMSIRTPLMFLFWTLFNENPFNWAPHVALSTWLNLGGLAIMLPAVILYNTGAPEVVRSTNKHPGPDHEPLLEEEEDEEEECKDNSTLTQVEDRLVN